LCTVSVCEYYEVLHVWHYIVAPVLSHWGHGIVGSRSSWPWSRLCHLHCQCLCGRVMLAFGLQEYVTESPLIITTLLHRQILGNSGFCRRFFFVICTEPQQLPWNERPRECVEEKVSEI
jgi:hypothetical protein